MLTFEMRSQLEERRREIMTKDQHDEIRALLDEAFRKIHEATLKSPDGYIAAENICGAIEHRVTMARHVINDHRLAAEQRWRDSNLNTVS